MSNTQVAETGKKSLMTSFAHKYQVEPAKMMATLKATAFRQKDGQDITDEQMMMLVLVANEHNLNPFLSEIYAFPSNGGVVPIVGVDGWARIINQHPEFDGMEFSAPESDGRVPEWIECVIYRKDRKHPISVREYFDEVKRGTKPWQSHPRRMLRHKAMIQCARLAFSFTGIYDPDEGERIVEGRTIENEPQQQARPALEAYPQERLDENIELWAGAIADGKTTPENIIDKIESRAILTTDQRLQIRDCCVPEQETQ